ncbi:hypothetical protein M2451_003860 [Dysgonomonas sp. PFB1-18]|uniref:hypothetical protein n=1 Tax=unclassified Dysgonomonas TaxID=2630389 RepID=UPI002474556A|nr:MULTISPECIES: hypothetical protein [unclassified Dysgonomonas]MDH6309458.1 hypothetical protein [Dysgonomonas sp. PF1-14]MDH6340868.1 hypothetical protein [Dysgonomonas sp. PF1-16]MDH6382519.1 hypothetical protein [Dysgonomonas sp. PFB1-18]MDH6399837.1 hypothetical protein [Dysgonomonas sp. PF1-23]
MNTIVKPKQRSRQRTEIRNILNTCFPKTDFTISTEERGNYETLTIHWTDGASSQHVWNSVKHLKRYSQPDIHICGITIETDRRMSERVKSLILSEMKIVFNLDKTPAMPDYFKPIHGTAGDYVRLIFSMRDF